MTHRAVAQRVRLDLPIGKDVPDRGPHETLDHGPAFRIDREDLHLVSVQRIAAQGEDLSRRRPGGRDQ